MNNSSSVGNVSGLKGHRVKINLGGPESRSGRLVIVKEDYLGIQTDTGEVIYYQLSHVKGVSINANDFTKASRHVQLTDADNFEDIFKDFKHKKIKVNRGGPESIEGVLNDTFKGHIELTVGDDIVFLSIFHIKSVSPAEKAKMTSEGKRSSGSSGKESSGNKCSDDKDNSKKRKKYSRNVNDAVDEGRRCGTDRYWHNDPYETGTANVNNSSSMNSRRENRRTNQRPLSSLERQGWIKLS